MKIHEYQAKELLASAGAAIPRGIVASSAADAQKAADIAREIYLGMVVDRAIGLPVVMACAEGGVEIEEVAARSPEKILKTPVNPEAGLRSFQARRLAFDLGFSAEQAPKAESL